MDLDIFVGSGTRVSEQLGADGNCARVVAVTSEIDKVPTFSREIFFSKSPPFVVRSLKIGCIFPYFFFNFESFPN